MKNGQIPDHWQLWLWIGLAALILAALARQSAIDTAGISAFNANLIFGGIIVIFGLLYLALHGVLTQKLGMMIAEGFETIFKWFGLKQKEPIVEVESIQETVHPQIEDGKVEASKDEQTVEQTTHPSAEIVKIETPVPDKIVIDYGSRRDEAKKRYEERQKKKETSVIQYVGYTMSEFVNPDIVEKIIDRVTDFINCNDVPKYTEADAITLPDDITTTEMMHFGWNIAKPFKKYNLHIAHFLKGVFPHTFNDAEVCSIERKLACNPRQGRIKLNKDVENFVVPNLEETAEQESAKAKFSSKKETKTKSESKSAEKKTKSTKSSKKSNSAREAAFADMELEPYCLGDNILEDDCYGY
ncbi:MAG: hypothetical protein NC187_00140 [Candidatus Amulumruptor caecigallinarius]|nr:hypothetical protein [Candidatus Amulumruptor caecigallinarius]MCM1395884.1 hypothetical protein [Candidatus Amulumruptor caecigallinarius]MCM1452919.1 hypothetical protein [bacterium]